MQGAGSLVGVVGSGGAGPSAGCEAAACVCDNQRLASHWGAHKWGHRRLELIAIVQSSHGKQTSEYHGPQMKHAPVLATVSSRSSAHKVHAL